MPARFVIQITPTFRKDLEALPRSIQERILQELRRLETDPFRPPPRIKRLKGKGTGQWRLRAGEYRVRYDVDGGNVVLYRARHRRDIYR